MPKVANKRIIFYHKDRQHVHLVSVMFNQYVDFFIRIPDALLITLKAMTQIDGEKTGARYINPKDGGEYGNREWVVTGETLGRLVDNAENVFAKLVEVGIKEDNVIVISHTLNQANHGNIDTWLADREIKLGAELCKRIVAGDSTKYFAEYYKEFLGENRAYRREVTMGWNENATVLPDTKENREFIKQIHDALGVLSDKIQSIIKDENTIKKFIESKQKLLS